MRTIEIKTKSELFDKLHQRTQIEDPSEIVNQALELFDWYLTEVVDENQILATIDKHDNINVHVIAALHNQSELAKESFLKELLRSSEKTDKE